MKLKSSFLLSIKQVLCFSFLSVLPFLLGCAATEPTTAHNVSLVSKDDQIYDHRFDNLQPEDIQLNQFWTEGDDPPKREPVLINNNTFSEIADIVKGGVVNIYTRKLEMREAKFGIAPNDLLPIKIPVISSLLDIIPFQVPIPFKSEGLSLGSGFIINEDGYILTNAHVIFNATDIRVVLSENKNEYVAKIIGVDRLTDTALIKIDAGQKLEHIPFGDSDKLRVGEIVLSVGNPLGLKHTVTSGLVSAKERVIPQAQTQFLDFIQTDSAINPGSSGGPLVNLYGEVVGINTAIVSDAQLIGFAIPINTVREIMPMLILGKTERGWFGATATPLKTQEAVDLGYLEDYGIFVSEIEKDSPAEKSGLQPKDIIVKLNGQPIKNFFVFRRKLLGLTPGKKIQLTVFRKDELIEITSTLVKRI